MKNFASLERRVTVLERPAGGTGIDPLVLALETLNDNELGLVTEFRSLINAGFLPEEIATMMALDAYLVAINAMEKVDQELQKLEAPTRPKREGKPLKLPKESGYYDPRAGPNCVEDD